MSKMQELNVDPDLQEMFAGVLAERARDANGAGAFDRELWSQFAELGLQRLTGDEARGGSGATWAEAQALIAELARAGVRSPYAEHDLLAGDFADELSLATAGIMTICVAEPEGDSLVAKRVPWASVADRVIVVSGADGQRRASSIATSELDITPGTNNIGEPRDTVRVSPAALADADAVDVSDALFAKLRLKQALVRAISVSAALRQTLDITKNHVISRKQFGRPLAKFQAVQNLVADIAAEGALAQTATESALLAAINSDWQGERTEFLVAVARSVVGHAASTVVRNAHQAHGAIGTTIEHELHRYTRAALAHRAEYGSVQYWDERVTALALAAGETGLWPLIAD